MPDASSFVPPIDVAMMWHAHLLSPARFYEDVMLRFKTKELIDASFPLAGCVRRQADPATIAAWELFFPDEPFDLNKDTLYGKGKENEEDGGYLLQCQENGCTHSEIISWSDYTKLRLSLNAPKHEHTCVNGSKITLNANYMVTKNLCRDLRDCMARNPSALAGVLLTTTGVRRITPFWPQGLEIFYSNVMRDSEIIHDYSLEAYAKEQLIAEWQKSSDPAAEPMVIELLTAIRTCYQGNPTRFSMDLIHGVCRQRPFYNLVASGNWRPLVRLRRVIRRYHDFLYTMRKGFTYQVPTLEMDVGWHTHMLFAGRYRMFTLSYLGNVPNHDDAVDPADMTRIAATMNYNILYTRLWEEFNLDNNMTTDDNGFKITSMIEKPNTIDMRPGQFHWGSIQCSFENVNSFSKYYTEEMLPSIVRPFNMLICHNCVPAAYYDEDNIMPWALRVWILERESIIRTSMKHSTYGYIG
ncbi:hypothetical protein BC940DRAFT_95707 [Gongronella butleri]|nr:hypothetical protein BC940DRAFT_95707 [Gongronella butleri]